MLAAIIFINFLLWWNMDLYIFLSETIVDKNLMIDVVSLFREMKRRPSTLSIAVSWRNQNGVFHGLAHISRILYRF